MSILHGLVTLILIIIIEMIYAWENDDYVNSYIVQFHRRAASIKLLQCSLAKDELHHSWDMMEPIFKDLAANVSNEYCRNKFRQCCLSHSLQNITLFVPELVLLMPGFPVHEYMFIEVKFTIIYTTEAIKFIEKRHGCHFFPTSLDPDVIAEAFFTYRKKVSDALGLEIMIPPKNSEYQKFFDLYSTAIAIGFLVGVAIFSKCYGKFLRYHRRSTYHDQRMRKHKIKKCRKKWISLIEYAVSTEKLSITGTEETQVEEREFNIQKRTTVVTPGTSLDKARTSRDQSDQSSDVIDYIDDTPFSQKRVVSVRPNTTPIIDDDCEPAGYEESGSRVRLKSAKGQVMFKEENIDGDIQLQNSQAPTMMKRPTSRPKSFKPSLDSVAKNLTDSKLRKNLGKNPKELFKRVPKDDITNNL